MADGLNMVMALIISSSLSDRTVLICSKKSAWYFMSASWYLFLNFKNTFLSFGLEYHCYHNLETSNLLWWFFPLSEFNLFKMVLIVKQIGHKVTLKYPSMRDKQRDRGQKYIYREWFCPSEGLVKCIVPFNVWGNNCRKTQY